MIGTITSCHDGRGVGCLVGQEGGAHFIVVDVERKQRALLVEILGSLCEKGGLGSHAQSE